MLAHDEGSGWTPRDLLRILKQYGPAGLRIALKQLPIAAALLELLGEIQSVTKDEKVKEELERLAAALAEVSQVAGDQHQLLERVLDRQEYTDGLLGLLLVSLAAKRPPVYIPTESIRGGEVICPCKAPLVPPVRGWAKGEYGLCLLGCNRLWVLV